MMSIETGSTAAAASPPRPAMVLELVPAVMLAAAIGFIAAVAPVDLVERVVSLSRLPAVVPAASPPLGATARAITVIGASGVTLVAAWLLLHMAGRWRSGAGAASADEAPRLRAADRHPDAPARRPFSAIEAFSSAPSAPPEPTVTPDQPVEQRTVAELLSVLESRLRTAGEDRLRRGHG